MDPLSASLEKFQKQFKKFKVNPKKKILCILSESQHFESLAKLMRAEEWQPDNRSPFIILHTPYLDNQDEAAEEMCKQIRAHFEMLQKESLNDGVTLPPLTIEKADHKIPIDPVIEHVVAFDKSLKGRLEPSFFCWFPKNVKNIGKWKKAVRWFYDYLLEQGNKIVLGNGTPKAFDDLFDDVIDQVDTIEYGYDQDASTDYFAKLFAAPSQGHIKGTPSGSAAPDVAPPPRKVTAQKPNPQDNPYSNILSPDQAEKLQTYVITAAAAMAKQDEKTALENQLAACQICEQAQVHLEHALMRLTYGNYLFQFKYTDDVMAEYITAEAAAAKVNAFVEIAQIRLAKAGLFMTKKKNRIDAIEHYEQAAAAAVIGGSTPLYIEALRMAGLIHLENAKDDESAYLCFKAVLKRCEQLPMEEVLMTPLPLIADKVIKLFEKYEMPDQVAYVQQLLDKYNMASQSIEG
jgi:hypothetical protein